MRREVQEQTEFEAHSPTGAPGFTRFRVQGASDLTSQSQPLEDAETESAASAKLFLSSTAGTDGLGNVELISLQDALYEPPRMSFKGEQRVDNALCQNMLGLMQYDHTSLALQIVDTLGASSKAGMCSATN